MSIKACFAFYNLYILKAEQSQSNACPGAFGFTLIKQKWPDSMAETALAFRPYRRHDLTRLGCGVA
ncbi:hypothetical protein CF253_16720 [Salmonella enterica]|nr:hypothetical protein [Salmonella enterica]EDX3113418.1 hypothetical protein [Salmonella enterica subsp. enterica serovar Mississippi]EBS8342468.1 hypothetical protein [Salmonella enterica]EBS8685749.1 hypothetical protein [Salmonella enterica]EBT3582390.1 hypothetical protein [Salmonella enterica]